MSEQQQGRNLAEATRDAGVECFTWSALPSSHQLSEENSLLDCETLVYGYVLEIGLCGCFIYTGNFYENLALRGDMSYNKNTDTIIFKQPIIRPDAELTMLYVDKDHSAIVKAVLDHWEERQDELDGAYIQASNARVRQNDIISAAKKDITFSPFISITQELTLPHSVRKECGIRGFAHDWGARERETMFRFYNDVDMHPGVKLPHPEVLKLGVKLHDVEDYVRASLLPHLGLTPVN